MPERRRPLRRGEIIGEVVLPKPATETDCLLQCPACARFHWYPWSRTAH